MEDVLSMQIKAGYTATLVACRWAGAVLEKVAKAVRSKSSKTLKK